MIHPTDSIHQALGVRDGRDAPVMCAACGCRLQAVGPDGASAWFHFGPMAGRDARGCLVTCSELAHDASGIPAAPLA